MGTLVSFSGIDGAGKSTQVKLLRQYLKGKKHRVLITEEMFGYFFLKPLVRVLRKTTNSPKGGPVTRNKGNLAKLWSTLAFIDIWLGYLLRIRQILKEYDFVIADRYYTDIWANLLYYGYLPTFAFKPFLKFLPQPDVAFVFLVNPKNVRKREDDFPLSYYQEQSKIYVRLVKEVKCRVIDANISKNLVFKEIKKELDL